MLRDTVFKYATPEAERSLISDWAEQRLRPVQGGLVSSTALYRDWWIWLGARGSAPLSHKAFSTELIRLGGQRVRRSTGALFSGVELAD
jgi:hypothetical protein